MRSRPASSVDLVWLRGGDRAPAGGRWSAAADELGYIRRYRRRRSGGLAETLRVMLARYGRSLRPGDLHPNLPTVRGSGDVTPQITGGGLEAISA
jgi:hypothetical protein